MMDRKIRLVQIGLGGFGTSWYETVLPRVPEIEVVGLVSRSPEKISQRFGFPLEKVFSKVGDALDALQPDLLLVVNPPQNHLDSVREALSRNVAVLCEKPIAESSADVACMLEATRASRAPLVISENYRYFASMRRVREILESGVLGKLDSVYFDFYRAHIMGAENYHMYFEQPMLLDVGIHHLDCIRYLTGQNVQRINACTWMPPWGLHKANADLCATMWLDDGTLVSYRGGLSFDQSDTDWVGNWRFACEKGTLMRDSRQITLRTAEGTRTEPVMDEEPESRAALMRDVVCMLRGGAPAPTIIDDNIMTHRIAEAAIRSNANGSACEPV